MSFFSFNSDLSSEEKIVHLAGILSETITNDSDGDMAALAFP